ncbi:MAG: nucleotidyl transferase AbiEii/AbiGii toxin family protein [gamma proteobacterium endosymbiont of Lamellibrachia anaximandri]|nr:nucleotidyl transferase AbiEii/AbiGii toxin family protein [gamma proteobacterium endosymbiont of Lamellibrachia anaximandri]MBL3535377.1 nucleotidyl transferase AbiEii/AbiGii toxin family protein [gamma proteobacterium endosymbiont of Lamellibrachia anaximandri]
MDRVARLPARERSELFSETATQKGTTPAVVEKDFWVTWVLNRLFQEPDLARLLMFKGGTSLSKVYHLIERFSEDIDLVLDWRVLGGEDPLAERSKTKQAQLNTAINEQAQQYIGGELLRLVEVALDGVCGCGVDDDPYVIDINYPAAFPDDYLRPEVRLEIGPLASWLPYEERRISCYAAEAFPKVFEQRECAVKVIKAERTFWEKATILHHEAYRPEGNPQPRRYSRHYYDLAKMAQSPVKARALADPELLASVVTFKQRFYPRGWARYDLAKPGTLRLVPEGHVLASVRSDYRAMENMIFGEVSDFEEILAVLQGLQEEINA